MIRVKDPNASLKFYKDVLGMELISGGYQSNIKVNGRPLIYYPRKEIQRLYIVLSRF